MEHIAYIAVGSNLGDRAGTIAWAEAFLQIAPCIAIRRRTAIIETKPLGGPRQRKYLNTVWKISTSLSAPDLMRYLLLVEKLLGRKRRVRNGPRTIDLDILFYDNAVIRQKNVIIPHPRLHKREFILRLLIELSPRLQHPKIGCTIMDLYRRATGEHHNNKS